MTDISLSSRARTGTLALAAWVCAAGGVARADFLVAPSGLASQEGNTALNVIIDQAGEQRFQQVYAASAFASAGGPLLITQIAFRPNAGQAAFMYAVPEIQFNLSTTGAQPNALSLTYANNVGADDTVVFAAGPLMFSSAATGPPAGPKDFDILVPLQVPFLYNPAAGNLLLDVRHLSDDLPLFNIALDADSLQLTASHIRGSALAAQAGVAESLALATRFEFQAVPGPPTLTLLGSGALGLLGYRCLRRKRA